MTSCMYREIFFGERFEACVNGIEVLSGVKVKKMALLIVYVCTMRCAVSYLM